MDIGKDSLINYDMFSETSNKLNVALMLHQKSRESVFLRSERAECSFRTACLAGPLKSLIREPFRSRGMFMWTEIER